VRKELGKLKEGMDGIHVVNLIISLGFSINFVYLNIDLYIDDCMCTVSEVAVSFDRNNPEMRKQYSFHFFCVLCVTLQVDQLKIPTVKDMSHIDCKLKDCLDPSSHDE
jgi:hypothetical protein